MGAARGRVFAALAEFIRELIGDGIHEGLTAARARGQRLDRPSATSAKQIPQTRALLTSLIGPGNRPTSLSQPVIPDPR
ncbi:recombinase family protein [Nocardia donostiensis]|uniref:recombinase family protein n=1 Tax=Nocardia donostiensis TaxID=1538463 RepID=UPI001C37DED5|nr:recombinase family protein [Nocardia donostiensis]